MRLNMNATVRSLAGAVMLVLASPAVSRTLPEVDAFAAAPPARRSLARPADEVSRPGTAVHV